MITGLEPEYVRWLTATTGLDRLGGDTDENFHLEDRGNGFVLAPWMSVVRLMEFEPDEDGCVTREAAHDSERCCAWHYCMWIEGIDYPMTPVEFGPDLCPDHGDACDGLEDHGIEPPTVGNEAI